MSSVLVLITPYILYFTYSLSFLSFFSLFLFIYFVLFRFHSNRVIRVRVVCAIFVPRERSRCRALGSGRSPAVSAVLAGILFAFPVIPVTSRHVPQTVIRHHVILLPIQMTPGPAIMVAIELVSPSEDLNADEGGRMKQKPAESVLPNAKKSRV